jgi:hypothetical protein
MWKLAAVAAAPLLVVACGGPSRIQETATSVPQRDLTLSTASSSTTQVVSKIELAPTRTVQRPRRSNVTRTVHAVGLPEAPVPAASAVEPAPVTAPVAPAPGVADASAPDPTGRELAPGRTVTVIPVSAGPSTPEASGRRWSEVPVPRGPRVMIGGHGGDCGGRPGRGPVSILK